MILKAKTFTAFQIQEYNEFNKTFLDELRIRLRAFMPIDDFSMPIVFGWTGYTNVMDTEYSECAPGLGEYLLFALRVDKRNVSSKVIQKYSALDLKKEREAMEGTGKKFITRDRKKEITARVKTRLMAKAEPVPSHYPVIVNTQTGMVFFGCSSSGIIDRFQDHFSATFEPLQISPLIRDVDNDGGIRPGRTFLTQVFTEGVHLTEGFFETGDTVTVCGNDDVLSGKNLLSSDYAEIYAGIRTGKEVIKLSMRLEDVSSNVWTFTCNSALQVSGLKMPFAGNGKGGQPDTDAAMLEEVYLLEKLFSMLFQACRESATAPATA